MKLSMKSVSLMFAGVVISIVSMSQVVSAVPGVLPPQTQLTLGSSTRDSYAKYQTIVYAATVQKPGKLSHIVMALPTGSTATTMRSSSGTVENYRPGQIIWRPAAPINVAVGTKLSIPVVGINFAQPGISNLWMTGSDAAGEVLAYARANFEVTPTSVGTCQVTGNNYIQTENTRPGAAKTDWNIEASKFDPNNFSAFANAESYKCGDIAYLKVDSKATSLATAKVYRMGYYGGTGAREIWSTSDYFLTGKQPTAQIKESTNPTVRHMVDASNWNYNIGIRIDGRFTPGTYLTKLTDRAGKETYVPFTVRDDSGIKHEFLLQQATTTWQAYNKFGGYSFYSPRSNGSSHLSFNRPYAEADGRGSGQFLQLESGLVYAMEKNGWDVAYWTDTDLHTKSQELASRTNNLVIPAHDEYYSYPMRSGLMRGIDSTVNLVSFGANQVHRPIVYGSDNRSYEVEGLLSGGYEKTTFRSRGPALTEQNITGAQYGCRAHGDIITNGAWLWNGLPQNTRLEGFANGEADYINTYDFLNKYEVPQVAPRQDILLTHGDLYYCAIKEEQGKGIDITARTTPAGTRVFGGSTFAYGCFITKSCPSTWSSGPRTGGTDSAPTFGTLQVSDEDSLAAEVVINNALRWTSTGSAVSPE